MDQTKARALVNFISWVITIGQTFASNLGYVPLRVGVVKDDQDTLKLLTLKSPRYKMGCHNHPSKSQ